MWWLEIVTSTGNVLPHCERPPRVPGHTYVRKKQSTIWMTNTLMINVLNVFVEEMWTELA